MGQCWILMVKYNSLSQVHIDQMISLCANVLGSRSRAFYLWINVRVIYLLAQWGANMCVYVYDAVLSCYIYVILNVYGLLIISAIRLNVIILHYLIQRWSKFTHTYALYILRICVQINKNNSIKLKALYADTTCRLYTIHFVTLVVANTIYYTIGETFQRTFHPSQRPTNYFLTLFSKYFVALIWICLVICTYSYKI